MKKTRKKEVLQKTVSSFVSWKVKSAGQLKVDAIGSSWKKRREKSCSWCGNIKMTRYCKVVVVFLTVRHIVEELKRCYGLLSLVSWTASWFCGVDPSLSSSLFSQSCETGCHQWRHTHTHTHTQIIIFMMPLSGETRLSDTELKSGGALCHE